MTTIKKLDCLSAVEILSTYDLPLKILCLLWLEFYDSRKSDTLSGMIFNWADNNYAKDKLADEISYRITGDIVAKSINTNNFFGLFRDDAYIKEKLLVLIKEEMTLVELALTF